MATESTSTTDFELRPARFSDLSSIATVWAVAFFDDEIIGEIMHPHRDEYPDDVYWFLLQGVRERFWDWRHHFIVVTDDGKVVGAADWRRLGRGGEEMELGRVDPRRSSAAHFTAYERVIWLTLPPQVTSSCHS